MPIRPGGVMNTTNAASTHHQFTGDQPRQRDAAPPATLLASASQVTHCSAVSVANGSDSSTCAAWVDTGVGVTIRGSTSIGGSSSSR